MTGVAASDRGVCAEKGCANPKEVRASGLTNGRCREHEAEHRERRRAAEVEAKAKGMTLGQMRRAERMVARLAPAPPSPPASPKKKNVGIVFDNRPRDTTGMHVIDFVRFGEGRFTTCSGCDFSCTGDTDEQMAITWNRHPHAMRQQARAAARHASVFDEVTEAD